MDIPTFLSLPHHKQCDLIWEEGQFIDSVVVHQVKANLYAVGNFFVEVLCLPQSTAVERIQVATDDVLSKYISHIDIAALFRLG